MAEGTASDDHVSKKEDFKVSRSKFQGKVKDRCDSLYQERYIDELRTLYNTTGAEDMVYVDLTNRRYGPRQHDYDDISNKEIFKALQQHRRLDDCKDKALVVWQCIGGSYEEYRLCPSADGQIFLQCRGHCPYTTTTFENASTVVGPDYESTVTCLDEYANNNGGNKTRAVIADMMLDAIQKTQQKQPDFRAKLCEQVRQTPREMVRGKVATGKEYWRDYAERGSEWEYEQCKTFFQRQFGEYGMTYLNELDKKKDIFKQGLDSLNEYFKTENPDMRKKGMGHFRKYFEEEDKEPRDHESILAYSIECREVEKAREASVNFILLTQIAEAVPPLGIQSSSGRTPGMDAYFRSALKQIVKSKGTFTFHDIHDHGIVTGGGGTQAGRDMVNPNISHDNTRQLRVDTLRNDTKGLFRKIVDDMSDDEEDGRRRSTARSYAFNIKTNKKKKQNEEREKLKAEIRREVEEELRKEYEERERTRGEKRPQGTSQEEERKKKKM